MSRLAIIFCHVSKCFYDYWKAGADVAAEAEEREKSQFFKIGPHGKFNFKFVRTTFGVYLAQLIGPDVYISFLVNWCVLTLCPWGLTFCDWCVLVLPWKRDDVTLCQEGHALL